MNQTSFNPRTALNTTKTIYLVLLAGPIAFFLISLYLHNWKISDNFILTDPLNIVNIVLLLTVPVLYKNAERTINQLNTDSSFREKISAYQTGLIIRIAAWEGIALFSCVNFLTYDSTFSIIPFTISVIGILSNYPKPEKIGKKMELTQNEIDQLKY